MRDPLLITWRMCPPNERAELLLSARPIGKVHVYSEIGAGLLIEELLAELTGRVPSSLITTSMLEPVGIENEVIIERDRLLDDFEVRARLRVPVGGLPAERLPLLVETLDVSLVDMAPSNGAFASARGFGRLFGAIACVLDGKSVRGLPSPELMDEISRSNRGRRMDALLERELDFVPGFALGLADHRITTKASPRALAHVGGAASAVALADPDGRIGMSAYLNGSSIMDFERAVATRMALTDAIFEDLYSRKGDRGPGCERGQ